MGLIEMKVELPSEVWDLVEPYKEKNYSLFKFYKARIFGVTRTDLFAAGRWIVDNIELFERGWEYGFTNVTEKFYLQLAGGDLLGQEDHYLNEVEINETFVLTDRKAMTGYKTLFKKSDIERISKKINITIFKKVLEEV